MHQIDHDIYFDNNVFFYVVDVNIFFTNLVKVRQVLLRIKLKRLTIEWSEYLIHRTITLCKCIVAFKSEVHYIFI
jgi:hypothetical protein